MTRARETLRGERVGSRASREGLRQAGRYFAMDWRLVGKEIVPGIVIAGAPGHHDHR